MGMSNDQRLELQQSQAVLVLNGGMRMRAERACTCGAEPGMFHNWGCGAERCPICLETNCGCSHD